MTTLALKNRRDTEDLELLDVDEAAIFLRVAKATVYDWVHRRKIPYRKHGKRLVFVKNDLERWSKSHEVRVIENGDFYPDSDYFAESRCDEVRRAGSLKSGQSIARATRCGGRHGSS